MESGLSHEHRAHRHHSRVRLRRLVIAHVAFRRRLLRALVLVAAAAAAAVVVIVLVQENGGGGGGAGYAGAGDDGSFLPFSNGGGNSSWNKKAALLRRRRAPSLSDCQTWIPVGRGRNFASAFNASGADLVRSCAVEGALARSARTPVCVLVDSPDLSRLTSVPWFARLRLRNPTGSLLAFAPSYQEAFKDTLLEVVLEDVPSLQPARRSRPATKLSSPSSSSSSSSSSSASSSASASASVVSPGLEPALVWALLWKHGGLVLSTNTVLVQSLETYYSFLWFDPALSEVSPNFFRLQDSSHRLSRMVLEHFAEQAEASALGWEEEEEEGEEDGEGTSNQRVRFRLTETDWSRIVEKFCGVTITEATNPRMCQDVEIISSGSVKSLADGGARSAHPAPGDLATADYVALNVLGADAEDGEGGTATMAGRRQWMREACPITHQAMFVK